MAFFIIILCFISNKEDCALGWKEEVSYPFKVLGHGSQLGKKKTMEHSLNDGELPQVEELNDIVVFFS